MKSHTKSFLIILLVVAILLVGCASNEVQGNISEKISTNNTEGKEPPNNDTTEGNQADKSTIDSNKIGEITTDNNQTDENSNNENTETGETATDNDKTDETDNADDNQTDETTIDNNQTGETDNSDSTETEETATDNNNQTDATSIDNSQTGGTGDTGIADTSANTEVVVIEVQDAVDAVVNKKRELSSDYVPADLVSIIGTVPTLLASQEVNQMRKEAADALKLMFDAELEETGIQLYAMSGYRSYYTQDALYKGYVRTYGEASANTFSAKPGQSEHQTGLVMDISSKSVNYGLYESFGGTTEGIWVANNAHKYGFIVRYPKGKEDITGYSYEPWHLRYLGVELATKVFESGLTLDEYFEFN